MLTPDQIVLVRKSWRLIRAIDPSLVAGTFYAKLFADYPRLRSLFPKDMEPQYSKLMDMLNAIVVRLDRLELLSDDIQAMAERHAAYGVRPEHYAPVGTALIWTLKRAMGKDWNPYLEDAWQQAYQTLATMLTLQPVSK